MEITFHGFFLPVLLVCLLCFVFEFNYSEKILMYWFQTVVVCNFEKVAFVGLIDFVSAVFRDWSLVGDFISNKSVA